MKLKVATCQFPLEANLEHNLGYVLRQMKSAKSRGAHVAHFSETALPGYAGVDLKSMERYDWDRLQEAHLQVAELARELKLWVVLGSAHALSGGHKPHNSLLHHRRPGPSSRALRQDVLRRSSQRHH